MKCNQFPLSSSLALDSGNLRGLSPLFLFFLFLFFCFVCPLNGTAPGSNSLALV